MRIFEWLKYALIKSICRSSGQQYQAQNDRQPSVKMSFWLIQKSDPGWIRQASWGLHGDYKDSCTKWHTALVTTWALCQVPQFMATIDTWGGRGEGRGGGVHFTRQWPILWGCNHHRSCAFTEHYEHLMHCVSLQPTNWHDDHSEVQQVPPHYLEYAHHLCYNRPVCRAVHSARPEAEPDPGVDQQMEPYDHPTKDDYGADQHAHQDDDEFEDSASEYTQ